MSAFDSGAVLTATDGSSKVRGSLTRAQETFFASLNCLARKPDDELLLGEFVEADKMVEPSNEFHWKLPRSLILWKLTRWLSRRKNLIGNCPDC